MGVGSGYLQDSFGFTSTMAGFFLATPQIILIMVLPFMGKMVDRFGSVSTFCIILVKLSCNNWRTSSSWFSLPNVHPWMLQMLQSTTRNADDRIEFSAVCANSMVKSIVKRV
jgi:MFS family permease